MLPAIVTGGKIYYYVITKKNDYRRAADAETRSYESYT